MSMSNRVLTLLFFCFALCNCAQAQARGTIDPPAIECDSVSLRSGAPAVHHFFDRENACLFSGIGASRTLDYFSTLNMRRRGRQEILLTNWVVDYHPLFAGIEVGGVALSIGVSYWLHRTGHHRLERAVSMVHIGAATSGAVRNYSLKTFHVIPATPN